MASHNAGLDKNPGDSSRAYHQNDEIPSHIVIIGASHAGVSFADQVRKHGFKGNLTLIDRQKGGPIERPYLSKSFLLETTDKVNPMYLLKRGRWYRDEKIILKHGVSVSKIDIIAKRVTFDNDESVQYDKLVLATGAVPRSLPECEGIANSFVLRQPDDAVAIRNAARISKNAIIIGGGYIGLEVAASLRQMGISVSVIEAADRLLARVASPPVAALLNELHHSHGVSLYTGVGVEKILQEERAFSGVNLSNGKVLFGDMLVVGIGVAPNSDLASQAGLVMERIDGGAIIVDEALRTSNPDIFAIGDVALKRGHLLRIESVHNAQDSAARAAAAIMGEAPPEVQAPWFWSDQYDANLQSVGIVPSGVNDVYQVARVGKRERGESFWTYREKQLLAVEAIRDPENFMLGKQCLEKNISPDPDLIGNPDFKPIF